MVDRDRASVMAYVRKVHCAVVGSSVVTRHSGREQNMFISRSRNFSKRVGDFRRIFDREGGIAHQLMLVSQN